MREANEKKKVFHLFLLLIEILHKYSMMRAPLCEHRRIYVEFIELENVPTYPVSRNCHTEYNEDQRDDLITWKNKNSLIRISTHQHQSQFYAKLLALLRKNRISLSSRTASNVETVWVFYLEWIFELTKPWRSPQQFSHSTYDPCRVLSVYAFLDTWMIRNDRKHEFFTHIFRHSNPWAVNERRKKYPRN